MSSDKSRAEERETFFLVSSVRLSSSIQRINIRNLSPGGALIEPVEGAHKGESAAIDIRNIGWVDATVAWTDEKRAGLRFRHSIMLSDVRRPMSDLDARLHVSTSGGAIAGSLKPTDFTLFYVVRWMKGHTVVGESKFEHLLEAKAHAEARLHLNRIRKGVTSADVCDLDGVSYFRVK